VILEDHLTGVALVLCRFKPQGKVWRFSLKNGTNATFQKWRDTTVWEEHFTRI